VSLAPREIQQPRTDYEAERVPAKGTSAFGRLYKQHFDGLYDFVARMVRDRDLAGEIVQNTFTKLWGELRAGNELRHPKSWLYMVARNQALDELRHRSRLAGEPFIYAQADSSRFADPQAVAEDNELVELVWSSAAALNPDEYSLLDMHVRQGFDAAELADALDLERGAVYTRLSRLRDSLEESVASTLLVRRGQAECQELACIVAEHDTGGAITPELRRAVREHVKHCDICAESRRRAVSPVALFGALVPIVPLAGMRDGILGAILSDGGHAAAAGATGAAGGVAATTAARQGGKAKYLIGAGGVAAAAAIVTVALSSGPHVGDPSRAVSVDHTVGVASSDRTVTMRWPPGENAKGYSVMFSRDKSVEPPARENVTGTQYTSAPLAPGRWWFILRTHGKDGGWTHTLRAGPFVITAATAVLRPAAAKTTKHAAKHQHRRKPARRAAASVSSPTHGAVLLAGAPTAPRSQPSPAKPAPAPAPRHKKPKANPTPPRSTPAPTRPPPAAPSPPVTPPSSPSANQPGVQTPTVTQPPPGEHGDDEDEGDQGENEGDHGGHEGDHAGHGN
jgi:RNA polymerase sigma factor (sigma-70 family)